MGQIFSYPIATHVVELSNNAVTVAQTKGHRLQQEDYYTISEHFNIPFKKNKKEIEVISNLKIMGIFDGHGGHLTAQYLGKWFSKRLLRSLQNCRNDKTQGYMDVKYHTNHELIIQRIKNAFWKLDIELSEYLKDDISGSTAILCVIINDHDFYSVNLGDSRLIMSTDGAHLKVLSYDHKPNHIGELIRINENGDFIANNRVRGILALSRSFGDFEFKSGENLYETAVIVEPEIIYHDINYSKDEFILLGSDGVFEVFNNRQLIKLINERRKNKMDSKEILKEIINETMDNANNQTGCGFDNMTMILYEFDKFNGKSQSFS